MQRLGVRSVLTRLPATRVRRRIPAGRVGRREPSDAIRHRAAVRLSAVHADSLMLVVRVVRALLATVASLYLLVAVAVWYGQTRLVYHPRKNLDATPVDLGLEFE